MKVRLHPHTAASVLGTLPPDVKRRIRDALRLLGADPTGRSNGLDVKRLDTNPGQPIFRVRLGDWRAAYTVQSEIFVLKIFHRDEGYGWLADLE